MNDKSKTSENSAPKIFRPEEEIEQWRIEYLDVRPSREDESWGPGAQGSPPSGFKEKRAEPRYSFMKDSKASTIYAHMGPRAFPILNISIGGIAFHSEVGFEKGTKLLMSALGMIALEVEVLECDMVEVDSDLMEFRYLVRAKFGPMVNGYQVYVLSREMHQQQGPGKTSLQDHTKPLAQLAPLNLPKDS